MERASGEGPKDGGQAWQALDRSIYHYNEDLGKGKFQLKTSAGKTLKQTIHCARLKFYHDSNNHAEEPLAPADLSDCPVEPNFF